MKSVVIAGVLVALTALGGCGRKVDGWGWASDDHHGRYVGIGLYSPGRLWSRLASFQASKAPAAARLRDDDMVIVVTDSDTGEIRACGNLSGFCIGQNPWKAPLPAAQRTPLALTAHQEDLEAQDSADAKAAAAPPVKPAHRHHRHHATR